jgi:hypothetical protein
VWAYWFSKMLLSADVVKACMLPEQLSEVS